MGQANAALSDAERLLNQAKQREHDTQKDYLEAKGSVEDAQWSVIAAILIVAATCEGAIGTKSPILGLACIGALINYHVAWRRLEKALTHQNDDYAVYKSAIAARQRAEQDLKRARGRWVDAVIAFDKAEARLVNAKSALRACYARRNGP